MRNLRKCPKTKKNIIFHIIKGHNFGTIFVIEKYQLNQISYTKDFAGNQPWWPSLIIDKVEGHFLEGDYPRTIPPKFGCNWPSGF